MIQFSVEGVKHEFDPDRLTFGEGRALEQVTGYAFKDLDKHMQAGEMTVLQAFVWVAMKRHNSELKFSDLDDMSLGDIEFHDDEEASPDPTGGGAETSTPSA